MISLQQLRQNILQVESEISRTLAKVGRTREDLMLVAVTKLQPTNVLNMALDCGLVHLGESKAQEAIDKREKIYREADWHFIGHLQSNKVKYIAGKFSLIHSVDSLPLADELEKRCSRENTVQKILIQVNTSGEESKYGVPPQSALSLINQIAGHQHLEIRGMMTIGRFAADEDEIRSEFRMLRKLFDEAKSLEHPSINMSYLSMGMTQDFKIAIEEGANIIRIGTALFGTRNYR